MWENTEANTWENARGSGWENAGYEDEEVSRSSRDDEEDTYPGRLSKVSGSLRSDESLPYSRWQRPHSAPGQRDLGHDDYAAAAGPGHHGAEPQSLCRRYLAQDMVARALAEEEFEMRPLTEDTEEQDVPDKIQAIKALPIKMKLKLERRQQLLRSDVVQADEKRRMRLNLGRLWTRLRAFYDDHVSLELWRGALGTIEGTFGTGVLSYFRFIRMVMCTNVAMFLAMLLLVVLPGALPRRGETMRCNATDSATVTSCCHANYTAHVRESRGHSVADVVTELLQGTGLMELTPLFFGFYQQQVEAPGAAEGYSLPLAFLLVPLACLLLCLVSLAAQTAHGLRDESLSRGRFYRYANAAFGGLDFCVDNASAAELKRSALGNELRGLLETDAYRAERRGRSRADTARLYAVRAAANLGVLALLGGYGFGIAQLVQFSQRRLQREEERASPRPALLYVFQYLPAVTLSLMNLFVSWLMYKVVALERWPPQLTVVLTLVRTLFLRVASVAVLLAALFARFQIECGQELGAFQCFAEDCRTSQCWETVVGQTCYKLVLTDFAVVAALTLLVHFPLRLLADRAGARWLRPLVVREFAVPEHVLDVVYLQTLCWLGVAFSPLLPGVTAALLFLLFHLKRFTCTRVCVPPRQALRSIRSAAFYTVISLVALLAVLVIVLFALAEMRPSRSCGPFSGQQAMWDRVPHAVGGLSPGAASFLRFLASADFAAPAIVVLLLALYYYWAKAAANRHLVRVLKEQLVSDSQDKQFLRNKLNELILAQ